MTQDVLVSIVLQTYNRRKMLQVALESAINQTYKNTEILIGDNCSTDATEEYCKRAEKKDSRIKYFRHKENIGMTNNANFLLDKVKGDYFVFLNDDDWLEIDYIEKCINFFQKNPDYSIVSPCVFVYQRTIIPKKPPIKKSTIVRLNQTDIQKRLLNYLKYQDALEFSTGCFKTSILKNIKKEEGQYLIDRYNEDIVLIMKFIAAGKVKILAETHLNKRNDGFSKKIETSYKVYKVQINAMKNVCKKRCEIFSSAIITDQYFLSILNEQEVKKLSSNIYNKLKIYYTYGAYTKEHIYKIKNLIKFLYNYRLFI